MRMGRRKFTAVLASYLLFFGSIQAAQQYLYLSSGDNSLSKENHDKITVYAVDEDSGKLSEIQALKFPSSGPMTTSPNNDFLYSWTFSGSKNTRMEPFIATLKINPDGRLKLLHRSPIDELICYLKTDQTGRYLAGTNYFSGNVMVWNLDDGVYRGEMVSKIDLELKTHSTLFSADNQFLLVPATEPNKVFVNTFNSDTGTIAPHSPAHGSGPPGVSDARQPRYLVFNQQSKDIAYTTLERENAGVGVWKWDDKKGSIEIIQSITTMPEQYEGRITTADLHLTPDNRYLYISRRNIPVDNVDIENPTDAIIGFSVNPETGKLIEIGRTPCERIPRSFVIDEKGKYLYVAGQGEDTLGVYSIGGDGSLRRIIQYEVGKLPTWLLCFSPSF